MAGRVVRLVVPPVSEVPREALDLDYLIDVAGLEYAALLLGATPVELCGWVRGVGSSWRPLSLVFVWLATAVLAEKLADRLGDRIGWAPAGLMAA